MLTLITGGSGSGKSEYAENLLLSKRAEWEKSHVTMNRNEKNIYIATMQCFDEESRKRIKKHRQMRSGKNFETIECGKNLQSISFHGKHFILLECMSNLVANEMFSEENTEISCEQLEQHLISEITFCMKHAREMIIVTNEVSSDGLRYDIVTEKYIKLLCRINQRVAEMADRVVEVVYGIPVLVSENYKESMR